MDKRSKLKKKLDKNFLLIRKYYRLNKPVLFRCSLAIYKIFLKIFNLSCFD